MSKWNDLIKLYRSHQGKSKALRTASLAQWIVESGRGKSALAKDHLNFAGIKYRARMAGYADPVDYQGTDNELTTYCKFASLEAFVVGYWHFIESGPYDGWKKFENDAAGYIRHIAKKGYAADPNYVTKVVGVIEEAERLLTNDGPNSEGAAGDTTLGRLAVVIGHNRKAQGASSEAPLKQSEYNFNTSVAAAMKAEAWHYNLAVEVFVRDPAKTYSEEIREVYAKVAAWHPDCAAELHFNAGSATASGSEVMCRDDNAAAKALAGNCLASIVSTLGLPNRKVSLVARGQRGAGSLYALDAVPTVLFEPFFGSNKSDCARIATLGQEALALAYLRGVRDWLSQNGDA